MAKPYLKNYLAEINRRTQRTEFLLIFCLYRVLIFGMMQVIAQSNNLQAELLEFLYGKIKQSAVIRFKAQVTALAQQLLVQCQEVAVRQTAFGMTCLRPGVAEIQIQLLDFARLEPVQQVFGVSAMIFTFVSSLSFAALAGK